jgi:hypothetical protein
VKGERRHPRKWIKLYTWWSIIAGAVTLSIVYLLLPAAAALYGLGDRRGPKIYPQALHEAIYGRMQEMLGADDAKVAGERPWFYGM